MNETKVQKYIQFPLCWLGKIATSPRQGIDKAISFGIMKCSKNTPYTHEDVARQVLYEFYHGKTPTNIDIWLEKNGFERDEDYRGFNGKDFEPEDLPKLTELLKTEHNDDALLLYQLHIATQYLSVSVGSTAKTLENYNTVNNYLQENEDKHGKQPFPSIGLDLLFSFRDNPENIELLLAYVAVKSLIGRNEFAITTKDTIIMRMIGAKSKEALTETLKNKALKEIYNKYTLRYWSDKLLNDLQLKGFIKSKIGIFHRICISTSLDYSALEGAVIAFKRSNDLKARERESRQRILEQLYNNSK